MKKNDLHLVVIFVLSPSLYLSTALLVVLLDNTERYFPSVGALNTLATVGYLFALLFIATNIMLKYSPGKTILALVQISSLASVMHHSTMIGLNVGFGHVSLFDAILQVTPALLLSVAAVWFARWGSKSRKDSKGATDDSPAEARLPHAL